MMKRECLVINQKELKSQYEIGIRTLWREIFHDSAAYENFYFRYVYEKNEVWVIKDETVIGMIHLNPYLCVVNKNMKVLHYIVGVATNENYQRQGVMRCLLHNTLNQMYRNKEPFSYLMPANIAYYEPFSFVEIQKESRKIEQTVGSRQNIELEYALEFISYRSYKEQGLLKELKMCVEQVDEFIQNQFIVCTVHDFSYFQLLYEEKACQNGDVVFAFDKGTRKICGFFAYVKSVNTITIEQMVVLEYDQQLKKILSEKIVKDYFPKEYQVERILSFPYMIRVVNVMFFLELFVECFRDFFEQDLILQIEDDIILENNGYYSFQRFGEQNHIEKQTCVQGSENVKKMTVKELAIFVFVQNNTSVFFSEVV